MNENCPTCQQNQYVIKAGFNRCRTQRYRCQQCLVYFTPNPKPHGYEEAVKTKALQLYLEGNSFRAIGRLLGVHNQSVINWINTAHAHLPDHVAGTRPTDYTFVDELFTFVESKKNKCMS